MLQLDGRTPVTCAVPSHRHCFLQQRDILERDVKDLALEPFLIRRVDATLHTYIAGAVKKLLPPELPTLDLYGIPATAGQGTAVSDNGNDDGYLGGVRMMETPASAPWG